jgi:hypothetical protein
VTPDRWYYLSIYCKGIHKPRSLSPRANYTDQVTAACHTNTTFVESIVNRKLTCKYTIYNYLKLKHSCKTARKVKL